MLPGKDCWRLLYHAACQDGMCFENCLLALQAYHLPQGVSAAASLPQPLPAGIPSEEQYVRMYCQQRGMGAPAPDVWAFYVALALFKMASILAGVHTRALQGNASAADAQEVGKPETVRAMAEHALMQLQHTGHNAGSQQQSQVGELWRSADLGFLPGLCRLAFPSPSRHHAHASSKLTSCCLSLLSLGHALS